MSQSLAALVLAAAGLAGLVLIPLGLPGLWLIVLAIVGTGWLTQFHGVSPGFIVVAVGLALLAELAELWLGFRFSERYGGSRRAGWGALAGGLIGAVVGVPVPIVGSVIGGFVGAFAGAALLEFSRVRRSGGALRAGWGAVLGRAAASAVKLGVGVVLTILALVAVSRG